MDAPFICGCHLKHGSAAEHKAFWDRYAYRRRAKVVKRERKKRKHAPLKFAGTYLEYLQSHQWQSKRKAAFARYGKKCCRCGATKRLNVHHRNYGTLFNESVADLEVLCEPCHAKEHGKEPRPPKRRYGAHLFPAPPGAVVR